VAFVKSGSPGGTRTPDQLVTSAPTFLPGLDYLIIRVKRMSGAIEVYWLGSSTSSLCTFLPTTTPLWQASLRITIEENGISSLGFPEFTRFFIPPHGGKLQLRLVTANCSTD
jgi:hypothetical protein